ncbi:MAG: Hpt domain-containing protein [Deltaproteobacteria bacterium]|nr:Hpt domain-containing protein [Deltaproteobacteria bacterium]
MKPPLQTDPDQTPANIFPESLPGVDVPHGLARLAGDRNLFRQLLISFSQDYGRYRFEIKNALAAGDWDEAGKLCHALKGIAAMISARDLSAVAAALNDGIRQGKRENLDTLVARFDLAFDQVMLAAAILMAQEDTEPQAATADYNGGPESQPADPAPMFNQMAALLKRNDFGAVSCFRSFQEYLGDHRRAGDLDQLGVEINRFDFDHALQTLTRLAAALEIPLEL